MVKTKDPTVVIIVLNWNGLKDTLACLSSVYGSNYKRISVLIIDNNSKDDELLAIKKNFPQVNSFQNQQNLGFTGGCNLGIEYALKEGADYVLLLNNDAKLLPDTLQHLIKKMQEDHSIGMISPVICDNRFEKIINCGGTIDFDTLERKSANTIEEYLKMEEKSPNNIYLHGTCLMIRTETIKQVGLLDNTFFAYHEDIDYSIRVLKSGWRNSVDINSFLAHGEKDAKRSRPYYFYMARNECYLRIKHSLPEHRSRNLRIYMSRTFRKAFKYKQKGELDVARITLDGIWNGYKKNYVEWKEEDRMPEYLSNLILHHPHLFSRIIWFLL